MLEEFVDIFSSAQQVEIRDLLSSPSFTGVIPAEVVETLAGNAEGRPQLLSEFVALAKIYAQPVISNFAVGAVVEGYSGAFYLGANMEIAGTALTNSVHAEQSAINNAFLNGEKGIHRIAISHLPCGHCRQFLNEIEAADEIEVLVDGAQTMSARDLLPHSFGPHDIGNASGLFSSDHGDDLGNKDLLNCLSQHSAAIKANSYAPYTKAYSYVQLSTEESQSIGAYIENAAYNPSLSPLLSALDRLRFKGIEFGAIKRAVLFERADTKVSQVGHSKGILRKIAPNVELLVINS